MNRTPGLVVLAASKAVASTAFRWVGPFLPTLERAFSTSTSTLTGVIGVAELGGLGTLASGRWLDRGREHLVFVLGMAAVAASSMIALGGTVATFACSFALLVIGITQLTTAGHSWISRRVAVGARSRAIGLFEISWAFALLIGAPLLAAAILVAGWRGAYVLLGTAAAGCAVWVWRSVPRTAPDGGGTLPAPIRDRLPSSAWPALVGCALTAAAGHGTFLISGTWLDGYGVSTGGLGLIAGAFGVVELLASSTVVGVGDRIGARRSVLIGHAVVAAGLVAMWMATTTTGAVAALLVFLTGFEFAFVSSLALVTEAAPATRGRAIGTANALSTAARATAVVASGQLYEAFDIAGTVALAIATTLLAATAILASPR